MVLLQLRRAVSGAVGGEVAAGHGWRWRVAKVRVSRFLELGFGDLQLGEEIVHSGSRRMS